MHSKLVQCNVRKADRKQIEVFTHRRLVSGGETAIVVQIVEHVTVCRSLLTNTEES